jgi:hypothetical protein
MRHNVYYETTFDVLAYCIFLLVFLHWIQEIYIHYNDIQTSINLSSLISNMDLR